MERRREGLLAMIRGELWRERRLEGERKAVVVEIKGGKYMEEKKREQKRREERARNVKLNIVLLMYFLYL